MQYSDEHLRYLRLLSQKYQTVAAAASEIIRIEALLRLPKGTEHFMSDLHGENEAFVHILNSASGVIREKIDTVLGTGVPAEERAELATLVYYPNQKLPELKARQRDLHAWYRMTLLRLIDLCRFVSSKHTRDHVRRCLPQNCGYILDELLHAHFEDHDKDQYYGEIIESIIRYDRADAYIIRFCEVIKRLAVDRLHIVGDLFDRGPRPDRILDSLMAHHQVDIQWQGRGGADALHHRDADGDVGHEQAVHHVHMDVVGGGDLLDVTAQVGKIGGENGGGDLDHGVLPFPAAPRRRGPHRMVAAGESGAAAYTGSPRSVYTAPFFPVKTAAALYLRYYTKLRDLLQQRGEAVKFCPFCEFSAKALYLF